MRIFSYKNWLFYLLIIGLLSFLSFYPAFNFSFIIDDWYQLWGVFYDHSIIEHYIKSQAPNVAYEFLILAPIFKFNPFYYQIVGYFLKIIDSVFTSLLIYTLTSSKKAAFYAGLIFAASAIGTETFTRISAQNSALLIPTIILGIIFWIQADRHINFSYKYILAILFIILSIIGYPGTGIIIIPVIFLYQVLNLIQLPSQRKWKRSLITIAGLGLPLAALRWYMEPMLADRSINLSKHILFSLSHPFYVVTNFLTSIGNLILGWFIHFDESYISLTSSNFLTQIAGYILIVLIFLTGFNFFHKKSEFTKIVLFFLFWIILFFFPSFFTQTHYVEGGIISSVSNRYLAISSIGFISLIAYLISYIKPKYQLITLLLIIGLNIWTSEHGLITSSIYRSQTQQDYLYNLIDQDLPKGDEKTDLLLFLGSDWLKIIELDWNGFYPLAVKRNIKKTDDFPTIISSIEQAKNMLCSTNPKFKLTRFYSWEFRNNLLYNVTDKVRQIIRTDKECRNIVTSH